MYLSYFALFPILALIQKLLETLESDDNEIKLKSIFVEARDFVANQIAEDLAVEEASKIL